MFVCAGQTSRHSSLEAGFFLYLLHLAEAELRIISCNEEDRQKTSPCYTLVSLVELPGAGSYDLERFAYLLGQ